MLKQPARKSSGLYISASQDRPDSGVYNMFEKYVWKDFEKKKGQKCFTPPFLQISGIIISDRYCHHRSDNDIITPRYVGKRK